MKNLILIFGFIALNCNAQNKNQNQMVVLSDLSDSINVIMDSVITECVNRWGYTYDTLIIKKEKETSLKFIKHAMDSGITCASTFKNTITFNERYLKLVSPKIKTLTRRTFSFTLAHEYFHALAGEDTNVSQYKIIVNEKEESLKSFRGLNINLKNGIELNLFNEACADYMAYTIDFIMPADDAYINIASLVAYAVTKNWLTEEDLVEYQKQNNVLMFASKFLNKKANIDDVCILYNMFQTADEGKIKIAIDEINKIRDTPH